MSLRILLCRQVAWHLTLQLFSLSSLVAATTALDVAVTGAALGAATAKLVRQQLAANVANDWTQVLVAAEVLVDRDLWREELCESFRAKVLQPPLKALKALKAVRLVQKETNQVPGSAWSSAHFWGMVISG